MSGYNTWLAQYLIVLISFTSGELDFTNSARELQELESGIMTSEAFRLTYVLSIFHEFIFLQKMKNIFNLSLQEPGDKCPRSLLEYELFKSKVINIFRCNLDDLYIICRKVNIQDIPDLETSKNFTQGTSLNS